MIIIFDQNVFKNQDDKTNKILAQILYALLGHGHEHCHLIDPESISRIFFNDRNEYNFDISEKDFSDHYLALSTKTDLREYLQRVIRQPITKLHSDHLISLKIGFGSGNTNPSDALEIIRKTSYVMIENYPNDWKFIQGIIEKYSDFGKRKNIYQLLKNSLGKQLLTYDHAGGCGSIKAQIEGHIDGIYKNIYQFKLFTIFDSDRSSHSSAFDGTKKTLMEYLKQRPICNPPTKQDMGHEPSDLIIWHMLYKRSIESYLPISVIIEHISLTENQKIHLESLTPDQIDFDEYYSDRNYISISKKERKVRFPEIFINHVSVARLEERCEHHKILENQENISEIEQILLKMVKII